MSPSPRPAQVQGRPTPVRSVAAHPAQRHTAMTGAIWVGLAKEIVPVLRGLGADPEDVIGEAGLGPGLFADENDIIPYAALRRVLAIGAERTQCPHLGLLVGQLRR